MWIKAIVPHFETLSRKLLLFAEENRQALVSSTASAIQVGSKSAKRYLLLKYLVEFWIVLNTVFESAFENTRKINSKVFINLF